MKHAHGHAAGPETLATGVAGKIGGKSWSFGCDRARGDAQSQEREMPDGYEDRGCVCEEEE